MLCSVKSTPIDCSRASRRGQRHQLVALARRHAGGRLVHQQQARPVGQRDRQLDALDVAVGQHAASRARPAPPCRRCASSASASPRELRARRRARSRSTPARRARAAPSARSRRTVSEAKVSAIWNVRPTPWRQIASRPQADQLAAGERHRAGVGRELAADHVEAGRLAGAVRADQRQHLAGGERRSSRRRPRGRRRTPSTDRAPRAALRAALDAQRPASRRASRRG